jgi:hypothetical protein
MTHKELWRLLRTPGRANYAPLWLELARLHDEKGEVIARDAAKYMATDNRYVDWPSARMAGVEMAIAREQRILQLMYGDR